MLHSVRRMVAVLAFAVLVAPAFAQSPGPAAVDGRRLAASDQDPNNWITYGRTYSEQHFSPLTDVNTATVARLSLAWHFDIDEYRQIEGTPLVIDGVMYVIAAWSKLYALDAQTGKELWRYDPHVPRSWEGHLCCGPVARGLAAWHGKILLATLEGRLVAVDAKTGRRVWERMTVDRAWPYSITGAPRVIKGKVIIGNAGADFGVRGYVTAYDADTGKQLWRFYTVPGDPKKGFENPAMAMAAKTWSGEWWKYGGGGTVWDSMSYDPELDLLYIGVGNGSTWSRNLRSRGEGDNLFLASIVALRPDTGQYVWHYQTVPGEQWDYTATQTMILAALTIDGKARKVLMQAPKNGYFYVLDRETGRLISAEKHAAASWAERIDATTGRAIVRDDVRYRRASVSVLAPVGDGAGDAWQPPAFDPRHTIIYFHSMSAAQSWQDDPAYRYVRGFFNGGVLRTPQMLTQEQAGAVPAQGYTLVAWDPVTQKPIWRRPQQGFRNGGLLATAGDLLFGGEDRDLVAYDAATGERLWTAPLHNHALAPPITFAIAGVQYVALVVGSGFSTIQSGPVPYPAQMPNTNRVLAYRLDGEDTLPDDVFPTITLPPPPESVGSEATIQQGQEVYARYCYFCHGGNAQGDRVHPDLRFSALLASAESWRAVVLGGARREEGMIGFKQAITPAEAEALRDFVIHQSRTTRSGPQQSPRQIQ